MADIFHEVDEEVRREQLKKLWDRYGHLMVIGALAIVIGIGGWRGYEYWQAQKAAEAGAAFERAMSLAEEGKSQEAEAAFAKVAAEGTYGYRVLARLREAGEATKRDPKAGVTAYDAIAADLNVPQNLRDLAAIRAGMILVDSAPLPEMQSRLEAQTGAKRAFRHTARELLALSAARVNDSAALKRWSELIMTDAETPAGLRSRIEMLLAVSGATAKG